MPAPTTLELLWGCADRPRRGPKPSLTLDRIVTEAIALADTEGLANLSMARLAERLGCAKMALYRYVPGRTELTALMLDSALGTPPENPAAQADSHNGWRDYLRDWTLAFYDMAGAHPWANELAIGIRPMGPNELSWLDTAVGALDGHGLTAAERFDAVVLLTGHARAIALQNTGMAGDDMEGGLARELGTVLLTQAERFPHAAAAFAETMNGTAAETGRDQALHFGIDRILDGLAALIETRR